MHPPRIVFVGHVCIDHNSVEGRKYIKWGSPALFMAKYLQAASGINPTIIASHGSDFTQFADGIDLLPARPNLEHSLIYENIVVNGRRTQYCHNAAAATPPTITASVKQALARADILFFAPLTPLFPVDYVADVTRRVPKTCMNVLLPQGYLRQMDANDRVSPREFIEAPDVLPLFNLVVLSDEDHPKAMDHSRQWKQFSPTTQIIVTENSKGADIITDHGGTHIPTAPVAPEDIVDSVGCGDVFSVATAIHYHQTANLPDAVRAGHAAARKKLLKRSDQ